jgi:hypothetical protein
MTDKKTVKKEAFWEKEITQNPVRSTTIKGCNGHEFDEVTKGDLVKILETETDFKKVIDKAISGESNFKVGGVYSNKDGDYIKVFGSDANNYIISHAYRFQKVK